MDKIKLNKNFTLSFEEFKTILLELNLLTTLEVAKNIVIKPNFAGGTYLTKNDHAITDINLLRTVIEYILKINNKCNVKIGESDSTGFGYAFLKFDNLGLTKWNIPRVELLDLSREELLEITNKEFKFFNTEERRLWLSKSIIECDFFISMANIKTHSITLFTGASKNLFGLLPNIEKKFFHPHIDKVVHDLAISINVNLVILDGFRGMEQNGPIGGGEINLGYRIFSNNLLLADLEACSRININYNKVKYLKYLLSTKGEKYEISRSNYRVVKPTRFLRIFNFVGLKIQLIGAFIEKAGHQLHTVTGVFQLVILIFRPLLLKLFDKQTLKNMKKKLLKN